MKKTCSGVFGLACLCAAFGAQVAATEAPQSSRSAARRPAPKAVVATEAPSQDAEPGARVVRYGPKDVVRIKTKLRYTTLIVLPQDEQILDFTVGDKDAWVINGAENFAYVKPAKAGAET